LNYLWDELTTCSLVCSSTRPLIDDRSLKASVSLMKSNMYKLGFELNDDFLLSSASIYDDSLELIEIEVRE